MGGCKVVLLCNHPFMNFQILTLPEYQVHICTQIFLRKMHVEFHYLSLIFEGVPWPRGLSALDLCPDGWVVRMWVPILAMTVVLVSLSKTLYRTCFCPPRSTNGYLWGLRWILCLVATVSLRELRKFKDGYRPNDQGGNNVKCSEFVYHIVIDYLH